MMHTANRQPTRHLWWIPSTDRATAPPKRQPPSSWYRFWGWWAAFHQFWARANPGPNRPIQACGGPRRVETRNLGQKGTPNMI